MDASPSYRALFRLRGFAALVVGALCARIALGMIFVALVLFVLRTYHSPALAGLAAFLWIFPGLVLSPVAGALLDRHGRVRLMVLDYGVQIAAFLLLGVLSLAGKLPPGALLLIVALASLTTSLSIAGARSLVPLLVPPPLWERANALDSQGYTVSNLVGPPLAGLLVGAIGGAWTLLACTALVAAGIAALLAVPEPAGATASGSLVRNARAGLAYVARSASLRGIALSVTTHNLAFGGFLIALPVLVLNRLHEAPVVVGVCYAVSGLTGIGAGVVAGRISTAGRERRLLGGYYVLDAVALLLLPWAGSLWPVLLAAALHGLTTGPADIVMFTLRQRRTDPAWFGRVFAVSMALNYAGEPIGSAAAGPLVAWSLTGTLLLIVLVQAISAVLPVVAIPEHEGVPTGG